MSAIHKAVQGLLLSCSAIFSEVRRRHHKPLSSYMPLIVYRIYPISCIV